MLFTKENIDLEVHVRSQQFKICDLQSERVVNCKEDAAFKPGGLHLLLGSALCSLL